MSLLPRLMELLGKMTPDASPTDGAVYERLRRWWLIPGDRDSDGTGVTVEGLDVHRDATLRALYGEPGDTGLGRSAPRIARWLDDPSPTCATTSPGTAGSSPCG